MTTPHPEPRSLSNSSTRPRSDRAEAVFLDLMGGIDQGGVRVTLPDGHCVDCGPEPGTAQLVVRDPGVFGHTLAYGDIGFAQGWMQGHWTTSDLAALLTVLARNRDSIARGLHGNLLYLLGHKLWTLLRANTRRGAKKNIETHYDLGNDFYALWLDPTMTYSSALYADPGAVAAGSGPALSDMPLEQAQRNKVRRMLQRAGVQPGQRVLEIGCGWGGLAEIAATEFGARIHGITLSPAQLAFARERAERGGWADRASFELRDYRDVTDSFDHIVSCEMFEAVGESFWPPYFRQVHRCLKPGGRAVIQTITIRDDLFPAYRKGTDFIQRYIFPGGKLPSPAVFSRLARRAGLRIDGDFAFGLDYARTLAEWDRRFVAVHDKVRGMGFDERFCRMWRFYLAYCEAGFTAGSIDVHQYELVRA